MTDEQQNWLDEIMDHFDFAKVARAMKTLGWHWGIGEFRHIPDQSELRTEARRMLRMAIDQKASVNTGGFYASCSSNGLCLKFILTDWEAFTDDSSPKPTTKLKARGKVLPATKRPRPVV
jgi:hypothetical protein